LLDNSLILFFDGNRFRNYWYFFFYCSRIRVEKYRIYYVVGNKLGKDLIDKFIYSLLLLYGMDLRTYYLAFYLVFWFWYFWTIEAFEFLINIKRYFYNEGHNTFLSAIEFLWIWAPTASVSRLAVELFISQLAFSF
jgi:hypothetical protein